MSGTGSVTAARSDQIELLCEAERWAQARPLVSLLLAGQPENELAWCLLAQCELGLGRYDQALAAAGQAAALAPDHEWPHRLVSFAASQLGRPGPAVRAAREAVRLEPEMWQTQVRLAAAVGRLGAGPHRWNRRSRSSRAEAGLAADRALALAPEEPQVQLIYGLVAATAGRRAVAEQAYRTALHLDPQHSGARHLLASLRLQHRGGPGGLAEAATGFAAALSADPTAQMSRQSLELTLRSFLGRAAYGLFAAAYLSQLLALRSGPWS